MDQGEPVALIAAADQALYQSKREGRNQVRLHGGENAGKKV